MAAKKTAQVAKEAATEKTENRIKAKYTNEVVPYLIQKFGYKNMGVSESVHGGAVWYDMILEFGAQES